jgi:hypothetical protein
MGHEDSDADAAALDRYATALAGAVEAALPGWVARSVARFDPSSSTASAAADAGRAAVADVGPRLRALLATDVDAQATSPLAIVRAAVRYPTEVLRAVGIAPVHRDAFSERSFPDDVYDLTPATWTDVDPALHEPGLVWGAAKAHVVLSRRRTEGRR